MALELAALRLFAPFFGQSIYVWGNLLSVVMVALALGYVLGGRLADRARSDRGLYLLLALGAFYQAAVVLGARALLARLAALDEILGSALATLILTAPPLVTLAACSPFVIRLLARAGQVGEVAGRIYALSTLGSVSGALLTAFLLVPGIGTQNTLAATCALSGGLALVGLATHRRSALLAMPVLLLPGLWRPGPAWPPDTIWTRESAYQSVRVRRSQGRTQLILNQPFSLQSLQDERLPFTGLYHDVFAVGPLLVAGREALSLGMAGGSTVSATWAVDPAVRFDAVEIDPDVVTAAARFFGLAPSDRLRIHVADARPWLRRTAARYDLIHADLFQGGPYVPFYLLTQEFFFELASHMRDDALLQVNVFDLAPEPALLRATLATARRVFPSVFVVSLDPGNHILFAFKGARGLPAVRATLKRCQSGCAAAEVASRAAALLRAPVLPPGTPVFTDDLAPVEAMTRRMVAQRRR
jgi:spermidine synthase